MFKIQIFFREANQLEAALVSFLQLRELLEEPRLEVGLSRGQIGANVGQGFVRRIVSIKGDVVRGVI